MAQEATAGGPGPPTDSSTQESDHSLFPVSSASSNAIVSQLVGGGHSIMDPLRKQAQKCWQDLTGSAWNPVYWDVFVAYGPVLVPLVLLFYAVNHRLLTQIYLFRMFVRVFINFLLFNAQEAFTNWLHNDSGGLVSLFGWYGAMAAGTGVLFGYPKPIWNETKDTWRAITFRRSLNTQNPFLLSVGAQVALKFLRMQLKLLLCFILPHNSRLGMYFNVIEQWGCVYELLIMAPIWMNYLYSDSLVWNIVTFICYLYIIAKQTWPGIKDATRSTIAMFEAPKEVSTEVVCGVCHEERARLPLKLACGHEFCARCISEWFNLQRSCPTCRAAIEDLPLYAQGETNDVILFGIDPYQIIDDHVYRLLFDLFLHFDLSFFPLPELTYAN